MFCIDPPQVIGNVPYITGYLGEKVTVNCPLVGNPPPVCSWKFTTCDYLTVLDMPSGVTFQNNNCSFTIQKLTSEYHSKCYICYARNSLGNKSTIYQSIQFEGM